MKVMRFKFLITLAIILICGPFGLITNKVFAQEVNFDFEDANLRTVIQAVAEFTGKNFLVDPRVQGKVTVVAPTPLSEDEAYKVFQAVLEVNGFVTVEAEGAIKIVPAEEGKIRDTSVYDEDPRPNNDDIETRVLRLTYVNPERLVPILRPLVPSYGHMAADSESSSLIITDRAANVDRIVSIVSRLDRPAESGEIEVIPLMYASAQEMSLLLGKLYPTESGGITIMEDSRTNSLIVKADLVARNEIRTLTRDLDMPTEITGDTHVIFLNNADAENLVEVLQDMVNTNGARGDAENSNAQITADPDTNALIIHASKSDFNVIRQVIEDLDVRRLQVYVEALIAEVSTDFAREFGLQFQTSDGLREGSRGVIGGTGFNVGTNIQGAVANPLATGAGLSIGFIDGTLTLPNGTEVANLAALARALDTQTNANILSTPNILTMDNQEAEIVVGQNVPFVTGGFSQISSGTAIDNPFQTIERRDVGLTLRIKPQITEGSSIKMEIYQEVSSVVPRGEARDIVTNTRSLKTTVIAENDRMIVLGGLIQDDISLNRQKVPFLGDIPILGQLFTYRSNVRNKTNLLVFLRPRIIRASGDMDEPTRRKYEYFEEMTREQELRKLEDSPPPLQEWDFIAPNVAPDAGASE
ncbi:MAG: type II secretion system secretin GspD [Gammaproteobacteria bacterium]